MSSIKVLAISGSLRTASYNRKALQIAKAIAVKLGADVVEADLKILNLPMYDGDIEDKGFPRSVLKLKKMVQVADILLIASPEYNYSITGALKNAIDWLSRGDEEIDGKTAIIFGVSSGRFGTVRGQAHLRQILGANNVHILPQPQVLIGPAEEAFTAKGEFKNKKTHELLQELIKKTFESLGK